MPKQAGDFAFSGTESFKLEQAENQQKKDLQQQAATEGATFMEIGKSEEKVRLVKQKVYTKLTGNPVIDNFNKLNDYFINQTKIKVREIATFFRLLSIMLNAGVPLIKSLDTLSIQSEKNPKLTRVLADMAQRVEQGQSLSEAMAGYPDVFTEAQVGMVRSGEVTGQLNMILKDLATEAEQSARIAGKVKGALIYPVAILTILAVVIVVMMVAVVPQMMELFTQTDQELPLITRMLIATSDLMRENILMMGLGVVLFVLAFISINKTQKGKYMIHKALLALPVFGNIVKKSALAKFANSFGNLLGSGVSIVQSLQIVAGAIGNEVYKKRLMFAAEDLKRGIPLAENLSESKYFPKMLVNMIEVGEKTAQLETVTKKIAGFYSEEVDNIVNGLTKIMEPMIIVIIGVTVGGLVAAIMMPIIQLTNVAGV